ncbi:SWIM-type domain-containing protein [Favolaschia claudopus]|uniref:SWIM-type domain-containing protein n=1 Tax=Favolaschia claudopus TaxID=2862362 RepID=A0AAW0EAQ3_9AGAR
MRPHVPYPWPWGQPSILVTLEEERNPPTKSWLDDDFDSDDSDLDSDYIPSENTASSPGSESASEDSSSATSDYVIDVSESELAQLNADAETNWPSSPTPSIKEALEEEELAKQIAKLVEAEQNAASVYNPDEVVALLTQLYELLISMGHWPEHSVAYAPHTNPPLNEALAVQLGYAPAAIALMHRLPYVKSNIEWEDCEIVAQTRFANYTNEECLREGRHPYPYQYIDDCPDIDAWLLPLMIPRRDGWNVMLDTKIGVIRAYCTERSPPEDTVEWRRYCKASGNEKDKMEYRGAPSVPASRYLSEIIYAYSSLSRLPIMHPYRNDPQEKRYGPSYETWLASEEREEQLALLRLYTDCGWPDAWRRDEFLKRWEAEKDEIGVRRAKHD